MGEQEPGKAESTTKGEKALASPNLSKRPVRRNRRHRMGNPRKYLVAARVDGPLYLALMKVAQIKGITISELVEAALWKYLSDFTLLYSPKQLFNRSRLAQALIREIVAEATSIQKEHAPHG